MATHQRAFCLDALRGYAIITMILSGQMLLVHLPAWMAHAQVPPGKGFDPSIYGITWVDLVFPFFLFAMGAAFPLSIGRKIENGEARWKIMGDLLLRGAMLVYFAIFFQHMKPYVIGDTNSIKTNLLSLLAFALMFPMFMNVNLKAFNDSKYKKMVTWAIKIGAMIVGFFLMNAISYTGKNNVQFDTNFSDIILIVLANMAFFGGIIYVFTYNKPLKRLLVLPFVMAVFLASSNDGWEKEIYNSSPIPWAYKFYYLKYLFIVIPGTIAGEYLRDWMKGQKEDTKVSDNDKSTPIGLALVSILLTVTNVIFLFSRQLLLNLTITTVLLLIAYFLLKNKKSQYSIFWASLFMAGTYCLILGLVLETYEGGIRKDPSTYSYYFVTSGLAFFALIFFNIICDYFKYVKSTKFLVFTGQNPMIAYVATSMLVMPVLNMIYPISEFTIFNEGPWMGFLRGASLTTCAVLVAMLFTKLKIFWRT